MARVQIEKNRAARRWAITGRSLDELLALINETAILASRSPG
jgi:hypothetical protein